MLIFAGWLISYFIKWVGEGKKNPISQWTEFILYIWNAGFLLHLDLGLGTSEVGTQLPQGTCPGQRDSLQDSSLLFHDAGSGIKLGSGSFLTPSADARRNLLYWACPEQEILMISSCMTLRERSIVWINRMWISCSVLREMEKEWEWMTDEAPKRFIFSIESYSLKIYILRKD